MDKLRGCIVIILGYFLIMALGIAIMIYGWGLEVKNWWWVIGGGIIGRLLAELILAIGKKED